MRNDPPLTSLSALEPDPIFESAKSASAAGPDCINGTIGVLLDEEGVVLRFRSVERALQSLHGKEPLAYPPLAGVPAFLDAARMLLLEADDPVPCVASSGGTGALSVLLRLAHADGIRHVLLPTPTWPNHPQVIRGAGLELEKTPYISDGAPSFDAICEKIRTAKEPCAVIVHVCCHNPLGLDPVPEQWKQLVETFRGTAHIPLLDFAYQGLGDGVEEDALPVRMFRDAGVPCMIAWSASKNHGIYGLRTGAALVLAPEKVHATIQRHLEIISRSIVSVAPVTGQYVVAITQNQFQQEWREELADLRARLARKRSLLAQALPALRDACEQAKGLFVTLPVTEEQLKKLRARKIFLSPGGRLNIAGIPDGKMAELASAIAEIL